MFHDLYVGHFDPRDPVDTSVKPHCPKAQRPLAQESVDRALAGFAPEVSRYVTFVEGGYVVCSWSRAPYKLWETLQSFALDLAKSEAAVLMNEPPIWIIEFPEEARRVQEEKWAQQGHFYWGKPKSDTAPPSV